MLGEMNALRRRDAVAEGRGVIALLRVGPRQPIDLAVCQYEVFRMYDSRVIDEVIDQSRLENRLPPACIGARDHALQTGDGETPQDIAKVSMGNAKLFSGLSVQERRNEIVWWTRRLLEGRSGRLESFPTRHDHFQPTPR